eukprot:13229571-Heterocapsa_arctica.AAC.1
MLFTRAFRGPGSGACSPLLHTVPVDHDERAVDALVVSALLHHANDVAQALMSRCPQRFR